MKTNADNKRLKISVLIRHFDSAGGGAERYCVELTKKLAEIHEVHVFTQHNHESLPDIAFHQIPQWFKRPRYLNQLLFSYLTKRDTQDKFDIVHSHDTVTHANIYTLHVPCFRTKWTQAQGARKILRWLNTLISPRKLSYLWLENQKMRPLPNRHFISVSQYLSSNLVTNYPAIDKHITIAYPGIHPKSIDSNITTPPTIRKNLPSGAFLLLFVANDFAKKGLNTVLDALAQTNQPLIHLVVAGAGKKDSLTIPDILQERVHFLGVVKNMGNLYLNVDALIHPTLVDTYGMAVLEAMSAELPVIVSNRDYCGVSEHLTSQEALILNDPRDAKELSKNILLLLDENIRQKMAYRGFQKSQQITWDSTLEQTLKAYHKIDFSNKE